MLGAIAAIVFGLFVIGGGVWGYVKAKSKPSLISGVVSGLVLIVAGIIYFIVSPQLGLTIAAIMSVLLAIVFTIRLIKTKKFVPAGVMLIAAVVTAAIIFTALAG
jgi:uncharacterized membrane protein (UPF0136 family)